MKQTIVSLASAFAALALAAADDYSAANPKYSDELSYAATCDRYLGHNVDLRALNDHTERKSVGWNNDGSARTFTCSLETTVHLRFVEITAPRGTRCTLLDEMRVSVDDGSGVFGPETVIVPPP